MANTINTLGGLSLTAIAEATLPVLQKKVAPFTFFSTDFSSEVSSVGAAVATRIPTAMSASAYDATTGYASSAGTTTAVTTTLNSHIFKTVAFPPVEIGNAGLEKLTSVFIEPAVNSIVNGVYEQLYTLVKAANYPVTAYSASGASFAFANLIAGEKVLDISGSHAPQAAILNPNLWYPLVAELKANSVIGDSSLIRDGVMGSLNGRPTVMDAYLPTNSEALAGFVAGKDAIAIASRLPAGADAPGVESQVVTDPVSGFSVLLMRYYVPHLGQYHLTATTIFGVVKGNGSSLVRFLDTSNV